MASNDNAAWLSQLAGKPVAVPRRETLQDLIDSRPFFESLIDLEDLPETVEMHQDVVLRERDGVVLSAEVYVPEGTGPFPVVVHFHGGGFCVSRAINDRKLGTSIAERGHVVVNVDYALAPEHPFPWAIEDAVYATRWASVHAAEYRGDASRIVIEGGSAGAALAAGTIVALNGHLVDLDQGDLAGVEVDIAAAVLFYGIFSFELLLLEPGSNVGSAELWNRAYLGPHFTTRLRDPLASPMFAPNLGAFPPTYLSCGVQDSLLGHTLAMTKALADAGAPATLSVIEGANHGFVKMLHAVPGAEAELERAHAWLADHLSVTS